MIPREQLRGQVLELYYHNGEYLARILLMNIFRSEHRPNYHILSSCIIGEMPLGCSSQLCESEELFHNNFCKIQEGEDITTLFLSLKAFSARVGDKTGEDIGGAIVWRGWDLSSPLLCSLERAETVSV